MIDRESRYGRGWLSVVLMAGLLLTACSERDTSSDSADTPQAVQLGPAQLGEAEARTIRPAFTITALTEAIQSARVRPQVSARVLANHFKGGELVEKGELLVELDPSDYRAALRSSEAELEAARANFNQVQANWDRAQSLQPDGYISQLDFDAAKAAVESARAGVSQAEALLETAQLDLDRTTISAPFKGRISPPGHAVGDLVTSLSVNPMFELIQLDPIYVVAGVEQGIYNRFVLLRQKLEAQQRDIPELEVSIELVGGGEYPHLGQFQAWDPNAKAAPGMIVGRAEFPNPDQILLPGQNVTLRGRALEPLDSLFVPQRAVLQDQQGHYVMAVDANDKVVRRNIEVGIRDGADWSVVSGLTAGERIIVEGAQRLAPGTPVEIASGS